MTWAETPHAELLCGHGFWGDTTQAGASLVEERRETCSPAHAHSVQQTRAQRPTLCVARSMLGAAIALASLAWAVWPWVQRSQCVATQRDAVTEGDDTGGRELSLLGLPSPGAHLRPFHHQLVHQSSFPSGPSLHVGLSQAVETPSALPHSSVGVGRSCAVSQQILTQACP